MRYTNANLPSTLTETFISNKAWNPAGSRVPLHSNIAQDEALTLYKVIRKIKPQASAEVGFAQGISALAILKGLADNALGIHHVMDPFQERFEDVGLSMVERAGLTERIRFHRKFPEEVFPGLPSLQFVFVDASHLFDLTMMEFVLADKRIELNGVIAFHDMWMPSLQKLVRFILRNRSYELLKISDETMASSPRQRIKNGVARCLRVLPGARRIFRDELIDPWVPQGNLVFLKKIGQDERDWRFYQSF